MRPDLSAGLLGRLRPMPPRAYPQDWNPYEVYAQPALFRKGQGRFSGRPEWPTL